MLTGAQLREAWAAEYAAQRAGKCEALTRGSVYSVKGGNRYDPCEHPALWRVTFTLTAPPSVENVCGIHARKAFISNAKRAAMHARYPELGGPYYVIERLGAELPQEAPSVAHSGPSAAQGG